MKTFQTVTIVGAIIALAVPVRAETATAEELLSEIQQTIERREVLEAEADAIGLSQFIPCGKTIVTIPVIADGKHMISVTLRKADIVQITFTNPDTIYMDRSGAETVADSIMIHTSAMSTEHDIGLLTTKLNYPALLQCLDEEDGLW